MINLFWPILSVILISLLSFAGALSLVLSHKLLDKILIFFVSFSAGGMIAGAFFHLLPESLENTPDSVTVFFWVIAGFCLFFVLERILRWRHCHREGCETHDHLGWLNLFGDGLHNLLDGMIVFAAFLSGPVLGIPVVIAIILHEIPQEIGDFGVLLYSGFSRKKALLYNFFSALLSFFGVFLAYFLFLSNFSIESVLLPLAAGSFIYIAASDLIPELHKEKKLGKAIWSFIFFVLALFLLLLFKLLID